MPSELIQCLRIDEADLPNESVIFGKTLAMREVRSQIERILHHDLPVLIQGESGTGKEVIAKFLHARSDRRNLPFVKVNCSVLHGNSTGSKIFDAGRHTAGQDSRNDDLAEITAGGTLFLEEIGDLDWGLQAKLLSLLEDWQSGSSVRWSRPKTRMVCSTNRDLEDAVERRAFRRDLFHRVDVITLHLAPLRERRDDIPQLCEQFLEKLSAKFNKDVPVLNPAAIQLLKRWTWPGNLRELENRMARLVVLGNDGALEFEMRRQAELLRQYEDAAPTFGGNRQPDSRTVRPARVSVLRALKANRWHRRRASERPFMARMRETGVSRRRAGSRLSAREARNRYDGTVTGADGAS